MKTCLILIFFCNLLFSQDVFLSQNGSDSNSGAENSPIYSLQKAFDLAKNSSKKSFKIKVLTGVYYIDKPVSLDESYSSEGNNWEVIGDENKKPVFFGGNRMKPVLNFSTKNWEILLPKNNLDNRIFSFIYVNDSVRHISSYPKLDFIKPIDVKYEKNSVIVKIPTELNNILKKHTQEEIKNIYATFYVKWTTIIRFIDSHNYKNSTITFDNLILPDLYKIVPNESNFKVSNLKTDLEEGYWFCQDNMVTYKPFVNENINKSQLTVPVVENFLVISGKKDKIINNISFSNLSFQLAGKGISKDGYFPYQAAVAVDAVFDFKYAENIIFRNLEIKNIDKYAFWLKEGCRNFKISNSILYTLGAGGVKIGETSYSQENLATNNIILDNNIIQKGGLIYPDAVGVLLINSYSNTISHNNISDFNYTGISAGWVWGYGFSLSKNNNISYNRVYNIGKGILDDLSGIYTLGVSDGTIIENNVIYDVKGNNYGGWGIYTDEGSSNILIKNNLVYNCMSAGFHQHYGKDNFIENNIFAYNKKGELEATKRDGNNAFNFRNNIIVHSDESFFVNNWSLITKTASSNFYYSDIPLKNNSLIKKYIISEKDSKFINPKLQKKDFYYQILNPEIFLLGFRKNDFSKSGVYGTQLYKIIK